ncbi:MAG: CapA family protein [Bacteroidales bacterium]|nr:CapA family protein [Bacteroidales bacterium]
MRKTIIIILLLLLAAPWARAQYLYKIAPPQAIYLPCDTTSLFIIGDVMMHSKQLEHDKEYFLRYIEPRMQKANFCIANLEFSLGGPPYTGYPAFSTPDDYPEYVARCGADIFLLANNHILDRGSTGLERTIKVYDKLADSLGIRYTGIGREPLMISRRGLRIALVNFTYGTNTGPGKAAPDVLRMRKEDIKHAIDGAKEAGADFIVALPHWGNEYVLKHSANQEFWAKWLVDQGCCAVVGAHPHVVQDSTHIKGVPVIYSMGNAVSNMSAENTRLELAVTLRFVRDQNTGESRMLEPELSFMWCTLPGKLTESYATIFVDEWLDRRDAWLTPSDYDNMLATLSRVKSITGIK